MSTGDYTIQPMHKYHGVQKFLKDFVAAFVSTGTAIFMGYPLDTIRVRMQLYNSQSAFRVFSEILTKEGITGMYKGAVSPVLGRAPTSGIVWASNAFCRRKLEPFEINLEAKFVLSGMFAGVVSSPISCPIEHLKIKKQGYPDGKISYLKLIKQEKIRGLYKGMAPVLARNVPGFGVFFSSYHIIKKRLHINDLSENLVKKTLYTCLAGGMSGQLFWLVSYPIDMVKNTIQYNPKHTKIVPTFLCLYRENGIKRLYKGIGPCLLMTFPVSAMMFVLNEAVTKFLDHKIVQMNAAQICKEGNSNKDKKESTLIRIFTYAT
ncbi:unnamed protein product [Moneuplotes crassus]|uniref:Mitochondrial carrier protein n=1 Tax=Euplotes crassus TaxID=5936 RepID=A0AAD2CX31_EUPCR|nr:unnamed protein product [Moneuplotes crassus]